MHGSEARRRRAGQIPIIPGFCELLIAWRDFAAIRLTMPGSDPPTNTQVRFCLTAFGYRFIISRTGEHQRFMPAPKSIAAADLAKITQAAVKKVSGTGRIVKGPLIWGYILNEARAAKQLEIASAITQEIAASARAAGFAGLKAQPSVVLKPGKFIAGFFEREINRIVEQQG